MWCWALNCSTNLRGRSTLRSLQTTLMHPCPRCTGHHISWDCFVRIGAMLAYTPLDENSLALLLNNLHDFLKYLAKNSAILFSASNYEVAPSEYHRKAMWGVCTHPHLISINSFLFLSPSLVQTMYFGNVCV